MIEATAGKHHEKTSVLCLSFINAPPTSYDTIVTTLLCIIDKCKATNQSTCIVTFDQPLYWKACDMVGFADPDHDIANVVVRLGGFHLLMSFLASIGFIMHGSGLENVSKLMYADSCVQNIMSGHAYGRPVRAHSLAYLSLAKKIIDTINFCNHDRVIMDDIIFQIDRTSILKSAETENLQNVLNKFEDALDMLEIKGSTV